MIKLSHLSQNYPQKGQEIPLVLPDILIIKLKILHHIPMNPL
jgi:hypothetical protein